MLDRIALALLVIGGLIWGSIGIFQFDLVGFIGGGQSGVVSRIIYILVALAAIWCITLFFREHTFLEEPPQGRGLIMDTHITPFRWTLVTWSFELG